MNCHHLQISFILLTFVAALGTADSTRAEDWPQWRGPLGQGITSEKNLPPRAGSSLKVLWKTPIPGEGCSSPIVSKGRVYLTTAYDGEQRNTWERPAFWATTILAFCVAGLALTHIPSAWRALPPRRALMALLTFWTLAVVALTTVVLAKPRCFWQFTDPWSGTEVEPALLPWVETFQLRPVIVLTCGSLLLIYAWVLPQGRDEGGGMRDEKGMNPNADSSPSGSSLIPPLSSLPTLSPSSFLRVVTLAVTLCCSVTLGLVGWQPEWFSPVGQPCQAWLVTGGVGLLTLAGSAGWLGVNGKLRLALNVIVIGMGFAVAWWLFDGIPQDEFGNTLTLLLRVVYLVPGMVLLVFHVAGVVRAAWVGVPLVYASGSVVLAGLTLMLGVVVFVRANFLQPQTGVVRDVLCVDANSGEVVWHTPVYVAATEKRHSLNSLATPTPACDGERVYAYFGSGLAALDLDGRLLWVKRDPDFGGFIRYGAGSSVALAPDRIIIYRDSEFMGHGDHLDDDIKRQPNRRPTALIAYDKKSGAELWNIAPAFSHDSYMTPLVWTRDDQLEVVIATWKTLAGFALSDGALRWTHAYPMQQVVPGPAVNGDCLIVSGGNIMPSPIAAVRAPAGETPAQTIWFNRKTGFNIVSPVCWDGMLFSISHAGVLTCRDAETGKDHFDKRLGRRFLASLVAGDGKVYALDQDGTLTVCAADTNFTELATYSFDENCAATPALAEGKLFVRTSGYLYCLGSGE